MGVKKSNTVKFGQFKLRAENERPGYVSQCGRYFIELNHGATLEALPCAGHGKTKVRVGIFDTLDAAKAMAEQVAEWREGYERRPSQERVNEWHEDRRRYLEDDSGGSPWYEDLTGPIAHGEMCMRELRKLGLL